MNKAYNLVLLLISLLCFALVAVCLLGMFFTETSSQAPHSSLSLVCGIGFWAGNCIGIVLQIVVSKNLKRWYDRRRVYRSKFRKKRIGLFNFFSNVPAGISDTIFFLSTIAFIVFVIVDPTDIVAYVSLSVLFLSFSAHCILNGKNYYYITNYEYIRAQLTKEGEK